MSTTWAEWPLGQTPRPQRIGLDVLGTRVDLLSLQGALDLVAERLNGTEPQEPALAVSSVNLDHLHHFGPRGGARGAALTDSDGVRWLNLVDGAPIATRARKVTGAEWPRLAGSDLLLPILERARADSRRVGFLGGAAEMLETLRERLRLTHPGLDLSGMWSPTREEVIDDRRSQEMAGRVRDEGTDLLVVGLGKPRQEIWIQRHGAATGARVLLAFGASADFLAGQATRAPERVQRAGLEWGYRLVKEPRRLWRRYLVQGPPAYAQLRATTVLSSTTRPGG